MFERFDESARRALFFARYVATQHGSSSIDDAHLAAGVLYELPADEWTALGATRPLEEIKAQLTGANRDAETSPVHIPFAPSAQRALAAIAEIVARHPDQWISRGHLLMAVIEADETSPASQLLRAAGIGRRPGYNERA